MMSKGFIIEAGFVKSDSGNSTDLYIEDSAPVAPEDDETLRIWIAEKGMSLTFTRPEAEALVEAVNEILKRYPRKEAA